MDKTVVTTIKVVLTTVGILFVLWLLYALAPIFSYLLISLFLVLALEPSVKYFMKMTLLNRKVSRSLAVSVTFTLFILILVGIFTIGLPPLVSQGQKLLLNIAGILKTIPGLEEFEVSLKDFLPQLKDLSGGIVTTTFSVFSDVLGIMSVMFLSIYMSLDWANIKKRFSEFFDERNSKVAMSVILEVEESIGHWVKGELLLMFIVGLASFFGLLILGVDYPLALGLISGLLEIVPALGPVIAAVLAAVVGFSSSTVEGMGVVILYTIIQQVENNFLVPKIMQKVSGFSPLVILIALLVGSQFFGAMGAIVAVPTMMSLVIVIRRVLRKNI